MKSRDTLLRLKRFQVDEKRRRVSQIEMMIADFHRMASDLDREIQSEEARAGISDPAHFAYPTYAKAALGRRDNLRQSADNLKGQLEEAKAAAAVRWCKYASDHAASVGTKPWKYLLVPHDEINESKRLADFLRFKPG